MKGRYPTAVEREAAKRAGAEPAHPADKHADPLAAQIADSTDTTSATKPRSKSVGGSEDNKFNIALVGSVLEAAWVTNKEDRAEAIGTISRALAAIAPRDELEGLISAQLVTLHQASMECFRRAMIDGQTVEGRAMNLKQGTKASQTFASLLDTLNRHRGRVPQRVIVEHRHLHYHEDGKAPAARLEAGAAGAEIENQGQPHEQRAIAHASQPPVWSEEQERDAVRLPGDEGSEPLPSSRRTEPGRSEG